jgi:hypothetical protein
MTAVRDSPCRTSPGRTPVPDRPARRSASRFRRVPAWRDPVNRFEERNRLQLRRAVRRYPRRDWSSLARPPPTRGRAGERLAGLAKLLQERSPSQRSSGESAGRAGRQEHSLRQSRPTLPGRTPGSATASARGPDRIPLRSLNRLCLPRLPHCPRSLRPRSPRPRSPRSRSVRHLSRPFGNRKSPIVHHRRDQFRVQYRPTTIPRGALEPGPGPPGWFPTPANVPSPSIRALRVETARRNHRGIRLPPPSLPRPACCPPVRRVLPECPLDPLRRLARPMARPARRHRRPLRCSLLPARASRVLPVEWFRPRWRGYRNPARQP